MFKPAIVGGAIFGALAVALGAFGAHGLKNILSPELIEIYMKGVTYQFYHCFALLATGLVYVHAKSKQLEWATYAFIIGIILFSGSLYALSFLKSTGVGLGPVGIITPFGGLFFIAGWLLLAMGVAKSSKQ